MKSLINWLEADAEASHASIVVLCCLSFMLGCVVLTNFYGIVGAFR